MLLTNPLGRAFRWEPSPEGKAERAIAWGYGAAFVAALLAGFASLNQAADWRLFNADYLWMEDFLRDWLERGVDMRTWMVPGASNYFPDLAIYGLLRRGSGSVLGAYVGCAAAKSLWCAQCFYGLASLSSDLSRVRKVWFALLCSCLAIVGSIVLVKLSWVPATDFWQIYVVATHGGAFANALLALLLLLCWLRDSPRGRLWLLLPFALSLVAAASDPIYLVWFAIPALGALLVLAALRRISVLAVAGAGAVLFLAALLSWEITRRTIFYPHVPYDLAWRAGWRRVLAMYTSQFADYGFRIVLAAYLVALGLAACALWRAWRACGPGTVKRDPPGHSTTRLFLLTYAVAVWPAMLLAEVLIDRAEAQYSMGPDLILLFVGLSLLATTGGDARLWAKGWVHLAALAALAATFGRLALSQPAAVAAAAAPDWHQPYPELVACLDAHADEFGLNAGLADYWQARRINLFSRKSLRADQAMGADLAVFQWISNREMLSPKKHTFVVTDTPTNLPPIREQEVIDRNGRPDARLVCGGFPVLVYTKGIEGELAVDLRDLAAGARQQVIVRGSAKLLTLVGQWRGGALFSTGRPGYLQYGPYTTLPAGHYRVEWQGALFQAPPGPLGTVDICTNVGRTVLASALVVPAAIRSAASLAVIDFTTTQTFNRVEFRFFVNDKALVRLERVVVRRG